MALKGETVMYDIIIIGAGITGTMLARDLSAYKLKIAMIDKENDIANETTMANSAIVHTGYDPAEGTLKAKLNVAGAKKYEKICHDLGCKYKVVGAYIAACGEEEEEHLKTLEQNAIARGIPYEFLSGKEARREEEHLGDDVTMVLSFPTTAVIYPWEVAIACAEVAVKNGMDLFLNEECTAIEKDGDSFTVHTGNHDFRTKMIINASGVHTEKVARMVSDDPGFHITPRRGEYYVLDQDAKYVKHIIFPVPSKTKGKGVLAVPTVYGNTLIGPNSDFVDDLDDNSTSEEGLDYVRKNIRKTMKDVPLYRSIRTFAGLRPTSDRHDFVVEEAKDVPGFVNAASIESPGLASAPGVSEYIIENFVKKHFELQKNPDAVMEREAPVILSELSEEERNELIRKNPLYGKIICRCEQVSEGEIVDCIRSVCGARSVKGVKKRVRPGMGRCQGGFCEPLVLNILARELNTAPTDVVLDSLRSLILESENR
ncbi:MAG: NAD(P)/FAD-dependent oxidoreductase [Erysipelotrichaceae bacterium]|nr:NAD(P)/FAD-dependent oxidoreductase [Erysipelotrichaceae bacterium]